MHTCRVVVLMDAAVVVWQFSHQRQNSVREGISGGMKEKYLLKKFPRQIVFPVDITRIPEDPFKGHNRVD